MPKSRKRIISNYRRIRARNRKATEFLDRREAEVRAFYAAALPERQEYPPTLRGESQNVKPRPVHEPSRAARITEIPRGGLRDGTRVRMLDGTLYVSERGGLRRVSEQRLRKAA